MHFSSGLNSFFESHDLYIQIRAFLNIPYKKKNEIKINVWCGSVRTSVFLYKMLTHQTMISLVVFSIPTHAHICMLMTPQYIHPPYQQTYSPNSMLYPIQALWE